MARLLARRAGELRDGAGPKPSLKVVPLRPVKPAPLMDEITRDSHIQWIRAIVRAYRPMGMDLILKQALIGRAGLDDLTDEEVLQLHRDTDRARDCISDGITFEEAGLLRSHGEAA